MRPELIELYREYQDDENFEHLRSAGSNFVPGEGNDDKPEYMFIGEAPGVHENRERRPFVGPSGQLLREFIHKYDMDNNWLTNVVKYRPPQNRKPVADERISGGDYLMDEIDIVKPGIIVVLGGTALVTMFGSTQSISRVHGKLLSTNVFAMFHPAAALYDESKKSVVEQDFISLAEIGRNFANSVPRDKQLS